MQVTILDKETVEDIKPGRYLVSSDDPRYFSLLGSENVQVLGSKSADDGRHTLAIMEVGKNRMRKVSNPPSESRAMAMDPSFFSSAKKEYVEWKDKWWREAIQNSVDAGATVINCRVMKTGNDSDTRYVVICEDNGSGMDRDTVIDKFLAFGGSGKTNQEGKTGGFGKAKELLLLPWISWSILTGDLLIKGKGNFYTEEKSPQFIKGTALVVTMGAGYDDHTEAYNAVNVISKSYLPGVKFFVNGEVHYANLKGSKTVLQPDTDLAELYVSETDVPNLGTRGIVRANGLYMHNFYIGDDFKEIPIIEIKAPSIEVLSVSRDSFRDYYLRQKIDSVISKIQIDKLSSLRKKENLFVRKYPGINENRGRKDNYERAVHQLLGQLKTPIKKTKTGVNVDEVGVESIMRLMEMRPIERLSENLSTVSGETASAMMEIEFASESDFENAVKTLVWEPAFYIENEIPGFHPDEKFFPETMRSRIYMLAKIWTELVRFILIQLGCHKEFISGWFFSKNLKAVYKRDDHLDDLILLNPYKFENGKLTNNVYIQTSDEDIRNLYAMAIHECTHMITGISYHDESYASALTDNFAKCMPGVKKIQKIIKGIKRHKGLAE